MANNRSQTVTKKTLLENMRILTTVTKKIKEAREVCFDAFIEIENNEKEARSLSDLHITNSHKKGQILVATGNSSATWMYPDTFPTIRVLSTNFRNPNQKNLQDLYDESKGCLEAPNQVPVEIENYVGEEELSSAVYMGKDVWYYKLSDREWTRFTDNKGLTAFFVDYILTFR